MINAYPVTIKGFSVNHVEAMKTGGLLFSLGFPQRLVSSAYYISVNPASQISRRTCLNPFMLSKKTMKYRIIFCWISQSWDDCAHHNLGK
jgi:hypothetical protein